MTGPGGKTIDNNTIRFWEDEDDFGVKVECDYHIDSEEYHLRCFKGNKSRSVFWKRHGYQPRFGWDIDDAIEAKNMAEKLAEEIEASK